jgi:hypothetical protein
VRTQASCSTDVKTESPWRVAVSDFKPFVKNTLQGFFTLTIKPLGLEIKGCTYHVKADKRWVGLPARPWTDAEGTQQWESILSFSDKAVWSRLQSAILKALDAQRGKEVA